MVVTDLDGTLLNNDQKVSQTDFDTLIKLGKQGIIRVIATGRSPYSFSKVIPENFPIDYLVFSSGAGVMDYKTREILSSYNLPAEQVRSIAFKLKERGVSFKVLGPVPENHHYVYYKNGELHPDFVRRMEFYRGFETEISFDPPNFGESCQFLIILPRDPGLFENLKSLFPDAKVIRATSPMDHHSIWMEVYHPDVSKARGVDFVSSLHDVGQDEILGVGNDFNDLDLLAHAGHPFLVSNAPEEIRNFYPLVRSNNESGFTEAVTSMMPQAF